jgi:hypothetical protein
MYQTNIEKKMIHHKPWKALEHSCMQGMLEPKKNVPSLGLFEECPPMFSTRLQLFYISYSLHLKFKAIPRILESQSISTLTKIIEKITKIYNIK